MQVCREQYLRFWISPLDSHSEYLPSQIRCQKPPYLLWGQLRWVGLSWIQGKGSLYICISEESLVPRPINIIYSKYRSYYTFPLEAQEPANFNQHSLGMPNRSRLGRRRGCSYRYQLFRLLIPYCGPGDLQCPVCVCQELKQSVNVCEETIPTRMFVLFVECSD